MKWAQKKNEFAIEFIIRKWEEHGISLFDESGLTLVQGLFRAGLGFISGLFPVGLGFIWGWLSVYFKLFRFVEGLFGVGLWLVWGHLGSV